MKLAQEERENLNQWPSPLSESLDLLVRLVEPQEAVFSPEFLIQGVRGQVRGGVPKICISNEFPGYTDATGLGTTL